jgi:hypothetical protein
MELADGGIYRKGVERGKICYGAGR